MQLYPQSFALLQMKVNFLCLALLQMQVYPQCFAVLQMQMLEVQVYALYSTPFMMQVHPLCSSLLRMHPCDVNVEIQFILSLMAAVYALRSPMKIDVQTFPNSSLFVSPHSTTFPFHSDASWICTPGFYRPLGTLSIGLSGHAMNYFSLFYHWNYV